MAFSFSPMDETSARAIACWQYEVPYDLYNADPAQIDENVRFFVDPENGYYKIADESGDVVAYCCFGPEARVKGGDYRLDALDVGIGLRPDVTGQGNGSAYVDAVLDFARRTFSPKAMRVTVAAFNKRALRVCEKAGFEVRQMFRREEDGRVFLVLVREG